MSEEELFRRARRGDAAAFSELCRPHQRKAYNMALRLCGDPDLAADLCQDAFLRAYSSLSRLRGDAAFTTWLFRIVHNVCIDALRRRARHPVVSLDAQLPAPAAVECGPEEEVLRHELQANLIAALDRLSPDFRAAVVLRDVHGFSCEEAAAICGVPPGTLKSRLHRARTELRDLLRDSAVVMNGGARP